MNGPLQEYDLVRVTKLLHAEREFSGTDQVKRAPKIGDEAVICHIYHPGDDCAAVAVEKVDEKGRTVWLAVFSRDELELAGPTKCTATPS